ncbi:MAG: radical SAM protein [Ignisphaera sp.]
MPKLSIITPFDPWRSPLCTCPIKWVVHPYTGCSYGCLYCYAASYIPRYYMVRVKEKLIKKLKRDVPKIPKGALIEMSSSSDPYPPIEAQLNLTRYTLHELLNHGFKVLIVTKSTLILRDIDVLTKFRDHVVASITITTLKQSIALNLEPNAPTPSERLKVIEMLSRSKVKIVARVDPIVPLINDDFDCLRNLVKELSKRGVTQITSSTYKAKGASLRRLASAFPNVSKKLIELYDRNNTENVHGYRYLNRNLRYHYMKVLKELAEEEGLVFETCREGFPNLNTPGFACDGSSNIYLE